MSNIEDNSIEVSAPCMDKRERHRAIAENTYYRAGNVGRLRMFAYEYLALRHDFRRILWRSWMDVSARYKRSILGPYWLSVGTLTFVIGYSVLAGLLFQRPLEEFLGYIACGVIAWQLISGTLVEGTKIYVTHAHEIKSVRLNMLSLPIRQILKGLIGLAHSLPIVLIVVFFTDAINLNTLMVIPGLLIAIGILVPMASGLGVLAARFRDIEQLIIMLVQFMFYMTPILWKVEMLGSGYGKWLAYGNPLFYMLSIIRQPLMGQAVPLEIWGGALLFMVLSILVGYGTFIRLRQRIPFWV